MKTCEICGDEFEESRANQRFCRECGKNPEKARQRYARAERTVRMHMDGPYPYYPKEHTCKECGKKFITGSFTGFCSVECSERHRSKTARCPVCGRLLREGGNFSGRGYCSEECRTKAHIKAAKERGNYVPCANCGKMFIRHGYGNRCCSNACRIELKDKETRERESRPAVVWKPIEAKCLRCGKSFLRGKGNTNQKYCSVECQKEAYKEAHRKPPKQDKPGRLKPGTETNICAVCKTPYIDCRRMQSGFVYQPTGAKSKIINGRCVITECPIFK